jgi:hypothetical protein
MVIDAERRRVATNEHFGEDGNSGFECSLDDVGLIGER